MHQGAEGQTGSTTVMAPAHPRALHPLCDERLAGRLDHPRANRQMLCLHLSVTHAMAQTTTIGELGGKLDAPRLLVAQISQGLDDST